MPNCFCLRFRLRLSLSPSLQSLWRSRCARRELRRRRTEAREAGKLLQDKQALEVRVKEQQAVLETVQNQRNELRQQYRVRSTAVGGFGCLPGPGMQPASCLCCCCACVPAALSVKCFLCC